ncbi:site-specific integrase [Erwinia persicina]|uniref:site-specific integrase n=1 Tax=Erwinia persicina TaxID=55211 RepID=UPI0030CC7256
MSVKHVAIHKKPDPITRDEFPRLINGCKTRQTANLWTIAILTGLRHGELCALAWEDIDMVAKTITVTRSLTSQGLFTPPKTEAGNNRVISLVDAAVAALRDQMELTRMLSPTPFEFHTREYGEILKDVKTFVFNPTVNSSYGKPGSYYGADSLGQIWNAALKRAGLRHRKAYQSRHTYACWSLSAGANPNFVASQMGHADAQMVYRVYGTWMTENNSDQLTLMNAKLNDFVLHTCYGKKAV